MTYSYVPGEWTALAADGGLALLHPNIPAASVRAVWKAMSQRRPIAEWLEIIAGGGIISLPAFGLLQAGPDGVRVLVRGEVRAEVDDVEVVADGMNTWREHVVPAAG